MTASYWGCDIAGGQNTFLARILNPNGGRPYTVRFDQRTDATVGLAQHLWAESGPDNAPLFLVLDAVLSHCLTSPPGWRPVDLLIRRRIPNPNWVFSQNTAQGHRHLELGEQFGSYLLVAETNPRPCLHFMGADAALLRGYKATPKRAVGANLTVAEARARSTEQRGMRSAATAALWDWFCGPTGWIDGGCAAPTCDGHIDALACAMVAAAVGGLRFPGLHLVNPILGDGEARRECGFPTEDAESGRPTSNLLGGSPYFLLVTDEHLARFRQDGV